jgi:DNA-binding CsgD family transcriptional regulator/tetratricopeptide (TPR) repeat protein
MHGRDRELQVVAELLRGAVQGRSGILLIEGEPGSGKSGLLCEAINQAASQDFSLVTAAADEVSRRMPFAPLLAALREPPGMPLGEGPLARAPDIWTPMVYHIGALLERRAAKGPVLVGLDDLQYADPATLFALRVLPRHLVSHPLAWILARRTIRPRSAVDALFDLLTEDGVVRRTLVPLADDAATGLIADILGASPSKELVTLAAGAAGNPLLLTELMLGLQEESAIQVSDGTAVLVSSGLPQRLRTIAQIRLQDLRETTRQLLETAAVLGPAFRLEDLADMLDSKPAVLLPAVEEAAGAGLLTVFADHFEFRHKLIWQAVSETVPPPVRQALHRQFGELLLARGGPATTAASHLLKAALQPAPAVAAALDVSVEEILRSSPQKAADVALRAVELTDSGDPALLIRTLRAANALVAAARLDEAAGIVHATLAQPQTPATDTQLRCTLTSVLCLQGQAEEAKAEAETVLSRSQVTGQQRDEVLVAYLQSLSALGERAKARRMAEDILAEFGEHGEAALAGALSVLANICWEEGRLDQGLHLASEAVRRTSRISPDARHFQPLLGYAARLIDVRQLRQADAVIRAAADQTGALHPNVSEAIPPILRARADLAMGRIDSARTEAELALTIADRLDTRSYTAVARSILSIIALRKGDLRTAGAHLRKRPLTAHHSVSYARAETALAHAQFVEAEAGPQTAMGILGGVFAELPATRHVIIGDPTASVWLARTALAAGDTELAVDVADIADELARENPRFEVITAAAAHCRGVVTGDPVRLAHAVAIHPDPWARASAAEDLGMVLATTTDAGEAVEHFDQALGGYGSTGAERDLARVRRRLRRLGIRRRHWVSAERPISGWASLTETEVTTSALVAQGMTNQQVAGQMYITASTVAFHLRQIFRKLSISSRVELARRFAEQPPDWVDGPADTRSRGRERG